MNRRAWILIGLLLPVLALFAWLVFGLRPARDAAQQIVVPPATSHAPTHVGGAELALRPQGLEAGPSTAERTRVEPVVPGSFPSELDIELRAAAWVEGRVEFASDTPFDERAFVVARGREFEARPLYRGQVGPDGSFRVAFAQGTRVGWLRIDARYNYLEEEFIVRPEKPPAEIVLRGKLGGLVRGRISAPTDAQEFLADLQAGDVSAGEHPFDFLGLGRTPGSIAADLTYEIGGIEAAAERNVMLKARGFVPLSVPNVTVETGRSTTLDLAPELGVRVRGRVVDAAGAPVALARVSPSYRGGPLRFNLFGTGAVDSDEAGIFRLVGLEGGDLAVIAQKSGLEPLVHALGTCANGALIENVELVLSEGSIITGRVVYGDDQPAARALVSAEAEDAAGAQSLSETSYDRSAIQEREPVETNFDGTFRLSGLAPGTYSVTAQAWSKDPSGAETTDEAAADGIRRVRRIGTPWSGRADRVAAGTSDVTLKLSSGETIRGIVADQSGKAVERFVVTAWPDAESPGYSGEIKKIERAFRDKHGRFALEGLRSCGWTVNVRARGYLDGEAKKINLPRGHQDLRFQVLELARISGVVTGPDSKPVAQAKVVCRVDAPQWWSGATDTRTNQKGEFALTRVPLGAVRVHAEANGFVRGEPLRFEVTAGKHIGGVALAVAKGATIRGVVKKSDGSPDAGRTVNASELDGNWDKPVKADAQGEFTFDGLAPGRYTLATRGDSEGKWFASGPDEFAEIGAGAGPERASTTVRVRAGEIVSVTLGGHRAAIVRMHGRILPLDRGAKAILVTPLAPGVPRQAMRAEIGEGGAYELQLRSTGAHQVSIEEGVQGQSSKFSVNVPDAADFEIDFALPAGSISGRVLTAEDAPVPGHRIRVTRTGLRDLSDTTVQREATSDDDGRFTIAALADGTYTVETNGPANWWEEERERGRARREAVVIAGGTAVADVDLVLGEGGTVKGAVRSQTGDLMPNAELFVFDEQGHAVGRGRTIESNSVGGFELTSLPAGRVHLYARTAHSAGRTTATVRADAPVAVDIVLKPRVDLTVLVQGANGAPIFAPLAIIDAEGVHYEEVAPFDRDLEAATGARSFPSLPAGRYTVRAFPAAGGTLEKSVAIAEGGRADLVLR